MEEPTPAETEHRFVVNSAEEAVRAVRARLGETAEVTSVRRVARGGLSGLFRGKQLEVIARLPAPVDAGPDPYPVLDPRAEDQSPALPWDPPPDEPIDADAAPTTTGEAFESYLAAEILPLPWSHPVSTIC